MSTRILSLTLALSSALLAAGGALDDGPEAPGNETVLSRYLEASKNQQQQMRGVSMDVNMTAELPKMKKRGRLQALRSISRIGRITYDALRFEGDNTVKKEVIARFLSTEVESTDKTAPPITPDFYKFKYKGIEDREGQQVHVLQLTPKKKMAGTFKGELWLDQETCLPVREAGRLAKNPSVFIKRFDFVRQYQVRDGMAVPTHTTGTVETRLWGKAEMSIDYSNFTRAAETAVLPNTDPELANRP
ncbi:MAG: hypothetical protein JNK48_08585 [Bryobacterales bacterium]|nr:hypothetical protein [Bryobacterales bacterium]